MTRKNLLDQRRSRAWQTHDEDWSRIETALAGAHGKEFSRELQFHPPDIFRDVVRTVRICGPSQCIAANILFEGLAVGLYVLQRLAERKAQMKTILVRQIGASELRSHVLNVCGREAECLEICKAPPRLAKVGLNPKGVPESSGAILLPSGGPQRVSICHPKAGLVWIVTKQVFAELQRFPIAACPVECRRLVIPMAEIVRLVLK